MPKEDGETAGNSHLDILPRFCTARSSLERDCRAVGNKTEARVTHTHTQKKGENESQALGET